jgi:hypothetical protein
VAAPAETRTPNLQRAQGSSTTAEYFAERLYHKKLNKDEMVLLASFIFREVNSSVQFCGKGTDMVLIHKTIRPTASISPFGVESIQREIPEFSKTMSKFWDATTSLPNWLTSVMKAEQEMPEEPTPSTSQTSEPEQ